MTFRFGRGWVLRDQTDGEGAEAGGGAAGEGAQQGGAEGEGEQGAGEGAGGGAAAGAGGEEPKDMMAAIDAGLGYKPDGKDTTKKAGEKKGEEPAAGQETETHHANGQPKKNDKGEDLDAEGKVVQKGEPKPKTAAELDLTPQEKQKLHAKTQARFGEVISTLKAHEATIERQNEEIRGLAEGRDAILGVLEETKTTQEQLAGYLEFNLLLQSDNPADLERALEAVEQQRAALYQALGREPEGGGLDLLSDFPDLQKQVEEEEITRKAALEIAKGRRDAAAREEATRRQRDEEQSRTQTSAQAQQQAHTALAGIEKWTADLSKSDLDYQAKEAKLLEQLDGVIKEYPPNLWLPTLKRLYAGIVIQKAPAAGDRQQRPLRPTGARPGAKAPSDMLEAINQGLGYAGAEKG